MYRNTGTGLVQDADWTAALIAVGVSFADADGNPTGYSLADVNADGRGDVLRSKAGAASRIVLSTGPLPDLLGWQATALGEATVVQYTPSTHFDHRDASGVYGLPLTLQYATSLTRYDGVGGAFASTFGYAKGHFDDGSYRGVSHSVVTDHTGVSTVGEYYVSGDLAGRPFQVDKVDAAGVLRRRETVSYFVTEPVTGVKQVKVANTDTFTYDDGASPTHVRVRRLYDGYLNPVDIFKDGNVDLSSDDIHEHYAYSSNLTVGFTSILSRFEVYDSAAQLVGRTVNLYDGQPEGVVTTGNLTRVISTVDSAGGTVARQFTYDTYGNPKSVQDEAGATTTFGYDASGTYRISTTDALGHAQQTERDARFGLPTAEVDINGNRVTLQYDGFARLVRETQPGDEASAFGTRSIVYSAFGAGQYALVRATELPGTANTLDNKLYYDGFGKVLSIQSEGSGGRTVEVDQSFDVSGAVLSRTLPYFVGDAPVQEQFSYDALGRSTRTTHPDGTAETAGYYGYVRVETDARGNLTRRTVDAFDRTVKIERSVGGIWQPTSYTYDSFGRLQRVVDAAANTTTLSYDLLGRKLTLSDPVLGNLHYSYDAAGRLLTQTDNTGRVSRFEYNALGEITKKTLGSGQVFTFEYGTSGANAVGQLVHAVDPAGDLRIAYDSRGNVTRRTRVTGGRTFVSQYTYDSLRRVRSIRYPDGYRILYQYDSSGLPYSVADSFGRAIVRNTSYTATGAIAQLLLGNNVQSNYGFDVGGHVLTADSSNSTGNHFQGDRYTYDAAGNVTSLVEFNSTEFSQHFTYDELNRLSSATSGEFSGYGTETYAYDVVGNLTRKGDLRLYYDGTVRSQATCVIEASLDDSSSGPRASPSHPCSIGWSSPNTQRVPGSHAHRSQVYRVRYDAYGNLSDKNSRHYLYDSEAHVTGIKEGSRNVEVNTLDAAGQRVVRWTEARETAFIDGLYETDSAQTRRHIPFGGGQIVATITSPGRAPLSAPASQLLTDVRNRAWPLSLGLAGSCFLGYLLLLLASRGHRLGFRIRFGLLAWELQRSLAFLMQRPVRWAFVVGLVLVQLLQQTSPVFAEQGGDASYPVDQFYYYHHDQVGNTKYISNFQGTVVGRREYSPFGEQLYSAGIDGPVMSDLSFGGHELDRTPNAELYHFNAREYDPVLGRFTSPDTVVPRSTPEALNRYVFNLNNPIRFADPTGHGFWDVVLGVVVGLVLVAATIVTLGVAGVLTGVILAVAIGAAIGATVAGIAAVVAAAVGAIDSFEQGLSLTLVGALIGGATGGAFATASAAYSAGATWIQQAVFGAFAGGALGSASGASAALINGDVDRVLLASLIGGAIGAAVGAVAGPTNLAKAFADAGNVGASTVGQIVATGKLVAAIAGTTAATFSLTFNGTAATLDYKRRLPQRVFNASLLGGAALALAGFIPAASSGGELAAAPGSL